MREKELTVRAGAVITHTLVWITLPSVAEAADRIVPVARVLETDISVSLPIFVASVIATAAFTWTIARYDASRVNKIDQFQKDIEGLKKQLEKAAKKS